MGHDRTYYLQIKDKDGLDVGLYELEDYLRIGFDEHGDEEYMFGLCADSSIDLMDGCMTRRRFDYESFLRSVSLYSQFKDCLFILSHEDERGYVGWDSSGKYFSLAVNGNVHTEELQLVQPDLKEIERSLYDKNSD